MAGHVCRRDGSQNRAWDAEHGVNLESLDTEVAPAPMSSELLFHAEAQLAVPMELSLDLLQARLETLADDLMVELILRSED